MRINLDLAPLMLVRYCQIYANIKHYSINDQVFCMMREFECLYTHPDRKWSLTIDSNNYLILRRCALGSVQPLLRELRRKFDIASNMIN